MAAIRAWLADQGGGGPGFDIVVEGETPADDRVAAEARMAAWEQAGASWWLETRWELPHGTAERRRQVEDRLTAGPPRPGG